MLLWNSFYLTFAWIIMSLFLMDLDSEETAVRISTEYPHTDFYVKQAQVTKKPRAADAFLFGLSPWYPMILIKASNVVLICIVGIKSNQFPSLGCCFLSSPVMEGWVTGSAQSLNLGFTSHSLCVTSGKWFNLCALASDYSSYSWKPLKVLTEIRPPAQGLVYRWSA